MDALEDFGKTLEAELEQVRRFLKDEVVPHTRRAAIEALRTASARLEELAVDLEARVRPLEKQNEAQPAVKAHANSR